VSKGSVVIAVIGGIILTTLLAIGGYGATGEGSTQQIAGWILKDSGVKGGLIVHIGCGDGRLTAALRPNDSYLVHGLDRSPENIEKARSYLRSEGIYGPVSVERWVTAPRLPYIDNLVNLIVVSGGERVSDDELLRVLAPNGVAYIREGESWRKLMKPRPREIDEWTHYLHAPDNNPVANDTFIGPPRRLQWTGGPRWARHHDHMASMSAMVSANGRIFYIMDEGPKASIRLPSEWYLTARDAFNGTILWKRRISRWWPHLFPLKSGPAVLPRRLVAVRDKVYTTLSLEGPLVSLDAATGKILRTYKGSEGTEEIIFSDGVLFVVSDPNFRKPLEGFHQQWSNCWVARNHRSEEFAWKGRERLLLAIEADTGKFLWRKKMPIAPLTLAVDRDRVYLTSTDTIIALDRRNGEQVWTSERVPRRNTTAIAPRLTLHHGVILYHGGIKRDVIALSAETGETLWKGQIQPSSHFCPWDILCIDGIAWSGAIAGARHSGEFVGLDVKTGEVVKRFPMDAKAFWMHQRCYPSKATVRYLIPSRTGTEFIDPTTGHWLIHHWVRGGCIYGVMPCNGLLYIPPHSCACYLQSKLNGFCALAPAANSQRTIAAGPRLERGPAYNAIEESAVVREDDWPTFRHDAARSGHTKGIGPISLQHVWTAKIGGKLTQPVVAGDKLYLASVDEHTLYALDAERGEELWTFTAGGRIDSPPTIYKGRVLFGCADGYIYCLRASDGALAWRFRAAPDERRLVSYNQVESVWPLHGSVLIQNGILYAVAGRCMFLDGGMRLVRLNPETGELLSETVLDDKDPTTHKNLQTRMRGKQIPVALPDVLSSDGKYIYMRAQQFSLEGKRTALDQGDAPDQGGEGTHLFCPIGFLDGSWWHRAYWIYGRNFDEGWGEWYRAAKFVPAGRILAFDERNVYGYGRDPQYLCNSSVLEYRLFCADKRFDPTAAPRLKKALRVTVDWRKLDALPEEELTIVNYRWKVEHPPLLVRAMALAGDKLYVVGPPDLVDEREAWGRSTDPEIKAKLEAQNAALKGAYGGLLWVVSSQGGEKLKELKLDTIPVFDGLIVARGHLYLSTIDGRVMCIGGTTRGE